MSKEIVSVGGLLIMVMLASAVMVRGNEGIPVSAAGRVGNDALPPKVHGPGGRDALRVKTDAARARLWVLGLDEVRVYDAESKALVRQVGLPNWSVLGFVCAPDLALDRSGAAFVTSNVQPRLWRIDAKSFEVTQYDISLLEKERWDIGFGALATVSDGVLYGLTSSGGSLWKIDVAGASASVVEIDGPPLRGCAFTTQFLNDFERSRKPWTRPSQHPN